MMDVVVPAMGDDVVVTQDDELEIITVPEQGPPGPPGPPGPGGTTILNGLGPPAPEVGDDGDFYIDTSNDVIYGPKISGAWGAGTSMVGPQGPTGPQGLPGVDGKSIRYGPIPPGFADGNDGDFWIETNPAHYYLYGPKAGGAWPAGTSLIGPTGATGPAGPPGGLGEAPTDGQTYGRKGSTASWVPVSGGGASVYIQDTAPVGAPLNSLWWNSSNGQLYVYYNDGTSTQWVFASSTQAASVPVVRSYLAGLTLSTAGGSATFSVAAGQAADSTNVDMMTLAASISKTTGAWAVGSGNGGLDTGAIAASGWYHVYLIKRPDTGVVDVCISTSASGPTIGGNIPSAYTEFRRIGAMVTSSSLWAAFLQIGDNFYWSTPANNYSGTINTGTPTTFALSVPSGITVEAMHNATWIANSAANSVVAIGALFMTITSLQALWTPSNGVIAAGHFRTMTNTSQQIQAVALAVAGTLNIYTYGWIDRRGRDN